MMGVQPQQVTADGARIQHAQLNHSPRATPQGGVGVGVAHARHMTRKRS